MMVATAKQRKAAEKVLENLGTDKPKSMGELLTEAGYAQNTADTPTIVTESKGFLQVLEEAGVTDDRISQVMEEGLGATKVISANIINKKGDGMKDADSMTKDFIEVPDYAVRHKYLDTAVKLKGHMTPDDAPKGNTYNTFIQQNNLNPNAPEAKDLVSNTLNMLMEQTKREQ